jgi:hypothetical protein
MIGDYTNGKNNAKQRERGKRAGGITGKGFRPGQSGNPKGRPRTKGLLNALKAAVGKVEDDGRTVEELLIEALIAEALKGRNRLPAIQTVFDRLEGKPKQQVDLNDISESMCDRSDEELKFFIEHGKWPEDEEAKHD